MQHHLNTRLTAALSCLTLAMILCAGCSDDDVTGKDAGKLDSTVADAPVTTPDQAAATCAMGKAINACTGSGACKATRDCSLASGSGLAGSCLSKLCVPDPTNEAKIKKNDKWDTSPDLTCLAKAPALPTGSTEATLWGPVEPFGMGEDTSGVKVEIFDAAKDPGLKTPLASTTSAVAKDTADCAPACDSSKVCLKGACVKEKDSSGNPIGYVEAAKIPTNTLLVFRASKTGFATTTQYNLWLRADKVTSGRYHETVYVVSTVSKNLIAAAAGAQILLGTAALAGEVHDCNDDIIKGAKVSLSMQPQKLAYFNGEEMPDQKQNETHEDGLYGAVNLKPPAGGSDLRFAAAALVGGKVVQIADFTVKVFADQITILTPTPWYPGKK